MVSQNEITQLFKIIDIFRTASTFSRIQSNIYEEGSAKNAVSQSLDLI